MSVTDYSSPSTGSWTQLILRVTHPDGSIAHSTLESGRVLLIGSGRGAGLKLESREVGSIHCAISMVDEGLAIRDWGSSTGTIVNGAHVDGEVCVPRNSQIQIGPYSICVRRDQDGVAADDGNRRIQTEPDAFRADDREAGETTAAEDGSDFAAATELEDASPADLGAVEEPWAPQPGQDSAWFTELDDTADGAARFGDGNPFDDDETELLRREVETLQQELNVRDELIAQLQTQAGGDARGRETEDIDPSETERLLSRVEDLREELEAGDARVAQLEELLRTSEEATSAEKDERQQLESWVTEIETRVAAREAEWAAQREQLLEQLNTARAEPGPGTERESGNVAMAARSQAATTDESELVRRIEELLAENRRLADERDALEARVRQELASELAASERSELLEVATARAELARQRAELVRREEELEKLKTRLNGSEGSADQKIRAFRDHLREIKSEEDEQRRRRRLGSRLASLWQRLEGR